MMVDEYTATKNPNIKKFNCNPMIPLRIKNHNIALPIFIERVKKNNLKNFEKLFISNIINDSKKSKSKSNEILRFYHPWLSNLCKNEEIHAFMSYCYGITKIASPEIRINKIKINKNRYSNNNSTSKDDKYKIIKILGKNRLNSVGTNTYFDEDRKIENCLNIENNNKEPIKYRYYPMNEKILSNSFRSSYMKNKRANNENKKNNSYMKRKKYVYLADISGVKNNRSYLLNNNNNISVYNRSNDETTKNYFHNNSTLKGEYRTIKIKKIKNNDRYTDRKIFRDTFRIESKFNS
jgi:hypothetical protein